MNTHEERKEFFDEKQKQLAALIGETQAYSKARKPYAIGMGLSVIGTLLVIAKYCVLQAVKNKPVKPELVQDLKLGIVPILTAAAVVTYIGLGWAHRARRVSNMKTKINCLAKIFNEIDPWKSNSEFKL